MNCSSCGKKISKNSKFCPNCGIKIEVTSNEEVKEEKENIIEETKDDTKNQEENVQPVENNTNSTKPTGNASGAFAASIVVTILSLITLNFTALTIGIIAIVYLSTYKSEVNNDLKQRKIYNGKILNIVSWVLFGVGAIIRIICLVIALIPILFISEYAKEHKNESYEDEKNYEENYEEYYDEDDSYYDSYGYDNLTEIDYERFMTLYSGSTPSIVVLVQTNCGYCNMYKPIIDEIAYDEDINIYYLDITKLTNSEYNQLINSIDFFKTHSDWGTPTTLIVKNSSTIDYLEGYSSEDTTLKFYRENSIIK